MTASTYKTAILAIVVAIVGGVGSGLVAHWSTRKSRRVAAATEFQRIVLDELKGLYPIATKWPSDINGRLRAVFDTLQAAVASFRPFVPWWRKRAFDKAWDNYRVGVGGRYDVDAQVYHQYMAFSGMPDPKQVFRQNVAGLLEFAQGR